MKLKLKASSLAVLLLACMNLGCEGGKKAADANPSNLNATGTKNSLTLPIKKIETKVEAPFIDKTFKNTPLTISDTAKSFPSSAASTNQNSENANSAIVAAPVSANTQNFAGEVRRFAVSNNNPPVILVPSIQSSGDKVPLSVPGSGENKLTAVQENSTATSLGVTSSSSGGIVLRNTSNTGNNLGTYSDSGSSGKVADQGAFQDKTKVSASSGNPLSGLSDRFSVGKDGFSKPKVDISSTQDNSTSHQNSGNLTPPSKLPAPGSPRSKVSNPGADGTRVATSGGDGIVSSTPGLVLMNPMTGDDDPQSKDEIDAKFLKDKIEEAKLSEKRPFGILMSESFTLLCGSDFAIRSWSIQHGTGEIHGRVIGFKSQDNLGGRKLIFFNFGKQSLKQGYCDPQEFFSTLQTDLKSALKQVVTIEGPDLFKFNLDAKNGDQIAVFILNPVQAEDSADFPSDQWIGNFTVHDIPPPPGGRPPSGGIPLGGSPPLHPPAN